MFIGCGWSLLPKSVCRDRRRGVLTCFTRRSLCKLQTHAERPVIALNLDLSGLTSSPTVRPLIMYGRSYAN